MILGVRSASGTCYYLRDVAMTTSSETAGAYASNTTCVAPGATTVSGRRWS